jgi:NTE family protein
MTAHSSADFVCTAARKHQHTVLVLQGGGALGAYQAGAFEAFAAVGVAPDWVAGVSIGAINAALIAGNPPELRVPRLREFWQRVALPSPLALPLPPPFVVPAPWRAWTNLFSATAASVFGVPGFFKPLLPPGNPAALGLYDSTPLRHTLLELVDFDRIHRAEVRLSLGAVDVASGNSVYFDNTRMKLAPEHILASGALPPGFAPVVIDGRAYWDGGIVSNSPLWYVLDQQPDIDALILQVDLFSASGKLPTNLDEAQGRAMDIRYSSKTRFNSDELRRRDALREAFLRLLDKLPPRLHDDPDVRHLAEASQRSQVTLVHLINRHDTGSAGIKDYEFSRTTLEELWRAGCADVQRSAAEADWDDALRPHQGVHVVDLTR